MLTEKKLFPVGVQFAFVMASLALLAGGIWFYHIEKSDVQQQVEKELTAIAQLKVDQIAAWRDNRLGDAAILTESPFFSQGVAHFLADSQGIISDELRSRLHSLAIYGHYANILLTDTEGKVRMSLNGNLEMHQGYAMALSTALDAHKPVFTELHTETKFPVPHISVVAPVFADQKQSAPLGAVILVNNAVQFLYPLIKSWPTPSQTAETLLIRRDGDSVLFLNDLRYRPDAALKLRLPLSRTRMPAAMAVLGRKGFVEGKDYRGVEVASVVLPIPDSSWYLVAKEDTAEIFAPWHFRAVLILGLFASFAVGIGTVWLLIWQRHKKAYYRNLYIAEARLRANVERHSITLKAVGDGVITADTNNCVEMLNPVAEALTGWSQAEAFGRPLDEVFHIINEDTREAAPNPVAKVLRDGLVVGLANHTLLIAKNGTELPIADSAAPIRDDLGEITGVVLVFRDQTEERRMHRLLQARLIIQEYAITHSLNDFLTKTLDETGALVGSPIGFYHYVEADQKTLSLQQWSTRTLKEFCRTEGKGQHYSIDKAGVWVDCVHQKKPIIHNDYASLPHKKGLPEGHAKVIRELVVPVLRGDKVVAILGVGNKATDYTDKDMETVSYLADVTWQIIDNKRTREVLQESEAKYRNLFENAPVGIFSTSSSGKALSANTAMANILGFSSSEDALEHYTDLQKKLYVNPDQRKLFLHKLREEGLVENFEYQARTADNRTIWLRMNARLTQHNEDGSYIIEGFTTDITAQRKLEDQFRQAQKMESVGRLAGGVAHDYNNMLSVILGHTELAMETVNPSDPLYGDLQQILKATERSIQVTRQLLAFARKQTIAPKIIDLNRAVAGMLKMLRSLIGEDIDLVWKPEASLWPVKMDLSQVDQILANLCVNARDAIKDIGKITIETGMVSFDNAYCNDHMGFIPGDFVLLAISDDGCGMNKEIKANLFEPFFTTKAVGQGTGLGLATVYGIVKQNNGFINVYSEPGQGTTFKIYMARHEGMAADSPRENVVKIPSGNAETIMIVEDEPAILKLSKTMLERLGYTVLAAGTPNEALRMAKEHNRKISLLLTDVIMPEMNGRDLADKLHPLYPDMKIIFMSGYTANVIAHHGVLDEEINFIQKPFSIKDLAVMVHKVIMDEKLRDERV